MPAVRSIVSRFRNHIVTELARTLEIDQANRQKIRERLGREMPLVESYLIVIERWLQREREESNG